MEIRQFTTHFFVPFSLTHQPLYMFQANDPLRLRRNKTLKSKPKFFVFFMGTHKKRTKSLRVETESEHTFFFSSRFVYIVSSRLVFFFFFVCMKTVVEQPNTKKYFFQPYRFVGNIINISFLCVFFSTYSSIAGILRSRDGWYLLGGCFSFHENNIFVQL